MMRFFCYVLFYCPFFFVQARTLEEIVKRKEIRVAFDGSTPGFNYFSHGELKGYDVDVAKALVASLGLKMVPVIKPFSSLLIGIDSQRDDFDVIGTSVSYTEERAKQALFLTPHYCTDVVFVSEKMNGPKSEKDLFGKKLAVMLGTIYQFYLEKNFPHNKAHIVTYPGESEAFSALLSKNAKIDAWVTERFIADYALQSTKEKNKEALRFKVQEVLFVSEASMLVAKGNTALKETLNRKLHELIQNKTLQHLSLQQFNSDILCKSK